MNTFSIFLYIWQRVLSRIYTNIQIVVDKDTLRFEYKTDSGEIKYLFTAIIHYAMGLETLKYDLSEEVKQNKLSTSMTQKYYDMLWILELINREVYAEKKRSIEDIVDDVIKQIKDVFRIRENMLMREHKA